MSIQHGRVICIPTKSPVSSRKKRGLNSQIEDYDFLSVNGMYTSMCGHQSDSIVALKRHVPTCKSETAAPDSGTCPSSAERSIISPAASDTAVAAASLIDPLS